MTIAVPRTDKPPLLPVHHAEFLTSGLVHETEGTDWTDGAKGIQGRWPSFAFRLSPDRFSGSDCGLFVARWIRFVNGSRGTILSMARRG